LNHCGIGLKTKDSATCYKTSSAVKTSSTKLIRNLINEEQGCLFSI